MRQGLFGQEKGDMFSCLLFKTYFIVIRFCFLFCFVDRSVMYLDLLSVLLWKSGAVE